LAQRGGFAQHGTAERSRQQGQTEM
jgi:hypothetical protein